MDHKAFKSDLTYAIKKLTKEGKTFTAELLPFNLQVVEGQLVWEGSNFDALEALVFVKGFQSTSSKEEYEISGLPLCSIVSEQGQISKTDLYEFLDGLENVAGNAKSEFYKVGVYIREKFAPVGARPETLQKIQYKEVTNVKAVRRFVVYNRPMPGCRKTGAPSIVEVECEV